MAEENSEVKQPEGEVKPQESVQLSPVEERAQTAGWKPKEQWVADGGDENEWRPAREFLDRGELFRRIEADKQELRNLRRTLAQFKQHYERVKETEYKAALETLKREKKAALVDGDADKVIDIDEQIAETRNKIAIEQQRNQIQELEVPEIHPDFTNWVNRNPWYQVNIEARAFADSAGLAFKQANPTASPQQVLNEVERKVRMAYPQMFRNPRREVASPVEGSNPSRKGTDSFELSDEERKVMNKLVKAKVLTEEQYIKDLKKAKETR